jgi:hypothetical protein
MIITSLPARALSNNTHELPALFSARRMMGREVMRTEESHNRVMGRDERGQPPRP